MLQSLKQNFNQSYPDSLIQKFAEEAGLVRAGEEIWPRLKNALLERLERIGEYPYHPFVATLGNPYLRMICLGKCSGQETHGLTDERYKSLLKQEEEEVRSFCQRLGYDLKKMDVHVYCKTYGKARLHLAQSRYDVKDALSALHRSHFFQYHPLAEKYKNQNGHTPNHS